MLNFEKVFSQIKKSVENDFLEVPLSKTIPRYRRKSAKNVGGLEYLLKKANRLYTISAYNIIQLVK